MQQDMQGVAAQYIESHKHRNYLLLIIFILSLCTILCVYGALIKPAISLEGKNISITAQTQHGLIGEISSVAISANACSEYDQTVFALTFDSTGGGLSEEYDFSNGSVFIDIKNGGTIELHCSDLDGATLYWFQLNPGEYVDFTVNCSSDASRPILNNSIEGEVLPAEDLSEEHEMEEEPIFTMERILIADPSLQTLTIHTGTSDNINTAFNEATFSNESLVLSWTSPVSNELNTTPTMLEEEITSEIQPEVNAIGNLPLFSGAVRAAATGPYTTYTETIGRWNRYYITIDGVQHTAYCHDHDMKQPSFHGTGGYIRYDYFSSEVGCDETIKQQVAAALYAGYPSDAMGYVEQFNLTAAGEAGYYTQDDIWVIVRGDSLGSVQPTTYGYAVQYYAQSSEYSHYWGATKGSISIDGDFTLTQNGNIYRTGSLTVGGSYNGNAMDRTIELTLPDGYTAYNAATDQPVSKLAKGDTFYIVYIGTPVSGMTAEIDYTYYTSKVWYYEQTQDYAYQNLVELERVPHLGSFTLNFGTPTTSMPVVKVWSDGSDTHAKDSVTVRLLANGVDAQRFITLNANNNWAGEFTGLPITNEAGETITYTVVEDSVPGYDASYRYGNEDEGGKTPQDVTYWVPVSSVENGGTYAIVYSSNAIANAKGEALSASPVIIGGSVTIDGETYATSINKISTSAQWTVTENGSARQFTNVSSGLPMKMKYRYSGRAAYFVATNYNTGYEYAYSEYYEFDGNFYINSDGTMYTSSQYAGIQYLQNAGIAVTSGGTSYTLYKQISGTSTGGGELTTPDNTVTITNVPSAFVADLNLFKTGENNAPLENVEFTLYAATVDGENWEQTTPETPYMSAATDTKGKLSFSNISPGTYLLYETKTAAGYILPDMPWRVTVTNTGVEVDGMTAQDDIFQIVNTLAYTLPETGGTGVFPIYLLGTLSILISVFSVLFRKKRIDERRRGPL